MLFYVICFNLKIICMCIRLCYCCNINCVYVNCVDVWYCFLVFVLICVCVCCCFIINYVIVKCIVACGCDINCIVYILIQNYICLLWYCCNLNCVYVNCGDVWFCFNYSFIFICGCLCDCCIMNCVYVNCVCCVLFDVICFSTYMCMCLFVRFVYD